MKSIKQQYIDLREGNITQANFMRNLRMSLPQYITNLSSFDDSIRILKNKGILTEADIKMMTIEKEDIDTEEETSEDDMLSNVSIGGAEISNRANPRDGFSLGFFEEGLDESIDTDLDSLTDELDSTQKETIVSIIKKMLRKGANKLNTSIPSGAPTNPKDELDLGYDTMGGIFEESLNEAKDLSSEGKWKTVTGKDLYAQFKEIDNLNAQEVLIGIDYEIEKNPELTKVAAAKIVVKNLNKNPIYYTATLMSGKEGYEPEYIGGKSADPKAHQMQPLAKDNLVDKARGMKPVKDVEKVKKDSDKGGETNTVVKGVSSMSLIAKAIRGLTKMDATGEKMKKVSVREGMESTDKIEVDDKVKIDPEVFPNINQPNKQVYSLSGKVNMKLTPEETYTVKSISGNDAVLVDSKGKDAGQVNMSNLIKSIDENDDREKYRKDYNAKTQASDAEQAKKDAEKFKKDSETQLKAATGNTTDAALASFPGLRERLKDMIRKELKETAGAYGYGDAMGIDEVDIYGIAGNPEEEMAARMARRPMDKYEPLSITKTDRDRNLDDMLEDAEYNIDSVVSQVGNDVKLGIALLSRAREIKPSLVPGLRQALNLYNK